MSHTPAPWKFEKHPPESEYFGNIVGYYTPRTIRTISCQLRYGPLEEQEANAALMAAAPDLLKHAKEVMEHLEKHGGAGWPHLCDTDDNAGQFLRNAIARAEGKATVE